MLISVQNEEGLGGSLCRKLIRDFAEDCVRAGINQTLIMNLDRHTIFGLVQLVGIQINWLVAYKL